MENLIKLTCKRAERKYELVDWNEFIYVKGYEVYNGDTPVCFISKCDTTGEWNANSFDDYENCEGLTGGLTKNEVLENIERLLREGTLYLAWDERRSKIIENINAKMDSYEATQEVISLENTWVEEDEVAELEAKEVEEKRNAELEQVAVGIDKMATEAAEVWKEHIENWKRAEVAEAELKAKEDEVKEAKSDEACKLFNELDDDGLVDTKHYDEALCQKQNIQHYWEWDLTVEDIETVIEYFKNLKQLIALERKVNKLAIYG